MPLQIEILCWNLIRPGGSQFSSESNLWRRRTTVYYQRSSGQHVLIVSWLRLRNTESGARWQMKATKEQCQHRRSELRMTYGSFGKRELFYETTLAQFTAMKSLDGADSRPTHFRGPAPKGTNSSPGLRLPQRSGRKLSGSSSQRSLRCCNA